MDTGLLYQMLLRHCADNILDLTYALSFILSQVYEAYYLLAVRDLKGVSDHGWVALVPSGL